MLSYKLLALDMDGTVLNEDQTISSENAHWIQKAVEAGITVMFSTGRAIHTAYPYAEQLQLSSPMITVNGSEVWKQPHQLLSRYTMKQEDVRKMYQLAMQYDEWYWAYAIDRSYNKKEWIEPNAFEQTEWLKFGYTIEDDHIRQKVLEQLHAWGGFEITNSSPTNIEVNPAGVSKASGLLEVCKLMGISMQEVVAVGDSINDLSAIEAVGLGVAMGNAQDVVKEAADVVVASNEEDGVAEVIQHYLLK